MNLFGFISQIFKPATELIDNLHTSEEEKLGAKAALLQVQANFLTEALDFEKAQIEAQGKIITAEAQSESWLTRNWRPMIMVACMTSVMSYWYGLTPTDPATGLSLLPQSIVDAMFDLVKIGVGGYIAGRSVEKTAKTVVKAFKEREET